MARPDRDRPTSMRTPATQPRIGYTKCGGVFRGTHPLLGPQARRGRSRLAPGTDVHDAAWLANTGPRATRATAPTTMCIAGGWPTSCAPSWPTCWPRKTHRLWEECDTQPGRPTGSYMLGGSGTTCVSSSRASSRRCRGSDSIAPCRDPVGVLACAHARPSRWCPVRFPCHGPGGFTACVHVHVRVRGLSGGRCSQVQKCMSSCAGVRVIVYGCSLIIP